MRRELDKIENEIKGMSGVLLLTPDDNPYLLYLLVGLGASHERRFQLQGGLDDLDKAIQYESRALSLTPDDHPDLPSRLDNLGTSHNNRYRLLGELLDLEKAIEYDSRALDLISDEHPDLLSLLYSLGVSHGRRYERLGKLSDLEQAIEYTSRALTLAPKDHSDLLGLLDNLGTSYSNRFQRLGEASDLKEAIEYESRALMLTPDDHPDLSSRLASIGVSFSDSFQHSGDLDDLEKAIEFASRALALTPDDHPDMPSRLAHTARSHTHRFERLGDLADLEQTIKYESHALALTPDDHPDLPSRLNNLAVSYSNRFHSLGKLEDLDKAIGYEFSAFALTPDGHPHLPSRLANLGTSYINRFRRLGDFNDLEQAIEYESRACALTPDGHPHLPSLLANLGTSYIDRFYHLGELEDLDKAIEYESRAFALTPDGHPHLPSLLANLGTAYINRFRRLGDLNDLEQAIRCESRALALTPEGHPHIPSRLNNLGAYYRNRFSRLGEQDDLEQAIKYESRAVALTPDASRPVTLVTPYKDLLQRPDELKDLEETLDDAYYPQAVSNDEEEEALLVGETQPGGNISAKLIAGDSMRAKFKHSSLPLSHEHLQNELTTRSTETQPSTGLSSRPTNGDLINGTSRFDTYEEPILKAAPISKQMTVHEVILHLAAHGCQDVTKNVDQATFDEHPICTGGFSDVYRGCLQNGTEVAIKCLRISMDAINTKDSKHLKHAARELHTWRTCDHPNVLKLHGLIAFRGRIGMVSPWMGRGNLPYYLEKTPGVDRCNLCLQICDGLSYMHRIGIVHGDLKGANVFISDDGTPVLADFGNSLHKDQSMKFTETTSSHSLTIRWSAAELLDGSGIHSEASDVYALGMTIYEVLAGVLPYEGKTIYVVINLVAKGTPPERPESITSGKEDGNKLWDLLLRCWSLEPKARPGASQVADMMKAIDPSGLSLHVLAKTTDP